MSFHESTLNHIFVFRSRRWRSQPAGRMHRPIEQFASFLSSQLREKEQGCLIGCQDLRALPTVIGGCNLVSGQKHLRDERQSGGLGKARISHIARAFAFPFATRDGERAEMFLSICASRQLINISPLVCCSKVLNVGIDNKAVKYLLHQTEKVRMGLCVLSEPTRRSGALIAMNPFSGITSLTRVILRFC